jgi:single-stranded-DNA-specific exonuclease
METYCRENLEPFLLTPALKIDEIVQVSEVSYHFIEELALLEPYGMSNPKPIFKLEGVQIQKKVLMGKNKEFTKFEIADGVRTFEAVSFDRSGYYDLYKAGDLIDLICHLDINEFKGTQTIQFLIKDIRGYREPLAKIATPFISYRKAEALRIIEKANQTVSANETNLTFSEGNSTSTALSQSCEVSSPNLTTWSIDSVEGLIYFYNRLYDDSIGHSKVVFCPSDNTTEPLNLTSVESHFNLAVSDYSKQQIASWIPDRNELIDFYKQVRSGNYLEKLPTTVRLWLCAMVLEAAGLISLGSDNVAIEPAPKEKLDLMEVPLYKALQVLKMTYKNA